MLSAQDFARITSYLSEPPLTKQEQLRRRKQALHETSRADVAKLTNTIEGQRKARLEAAAKRAAVKEAEEVKRDLEEAKFQADMHRKDIDRAKRLMFEQTDTMKALRSKMLLTEVVNERANQGNFAEVRATQRAGVEAARRAYQDEQIRLAEEAELAKAARAHEAEVSTAQSHLEKAAANRALRVAARQERLREQKAIDADYLAYVAEEEAAEAARMERAKEVNTARDRFNAETVKLRHRRQLLEDVQTEKNRLVQEKQDDIAARVKSDMLARRAAAIKRREELAASLAQIEADTTGEENRRIREAQEEAYRKRDETDARKARMRADTIKEINAHRVATITEKEDTLQAEMEADLAERRRMEADLLEAAKEEAQVAEKRAIVGRSCLGTNAAMVQRHTDAIAAEADQLRRERRLMDSQLARERQIYLDHATHLLDQTKANGDTKVFPLEHAIATVDGKKMKPRPFNASIDVRRKGNPYPGDTKRRVGFTY